MEKTSTQREQVLGLLRDYGQVTNLILNDVCFRYAARIHELRRQGHKITSTRVGRGVWEYTLHV